MMEHSQEHSENETRSNDLIVKLNHTRLWKRAVLSCEILRMNGNKTANCRERIIKEAYFRGNEEFRLQKILTQFVLEN